MTAFDAAPYLQAAAHWAAVIIGTIAYTLIQSHVKDKEARATVLAAIENGVAFGLNKVDGALQGKPLNVQLGSSVAAHAVKYALDAVPDALARLGLDETKVAKIAVAKLPGVEGEISDAAIQGIAAAASGKPAPPPDLSDLTRIIAPVILQAIKDGRIKIPVADDTAHQAPQG